MSYLHRREPQFACTKVVTISFFFAVYWKALHVPYAKFCKDGLMVVQ